MLVDRGADADLRNVDAVTRNRKESKRCQGDGRPYEQSWHQLKKSAVSAEPLSLIQVTGF